MSSSCLPSALRRLRHYALQAMQHCSSQPGSRQASIFGLATNNVCNVLVTRTEQRARARAEVGRGKIAASTGVSQHTGEPASADAQGSEVPAATTQECASRCASTRLARRYVSPCSAACAAIATASAGPKGAPGASRQVGEAPHGVTWLPGRTAVATRRAARAGELPGEDSMAAATGVSSVSSFVNCTVNALQREAACRTGGRQGDRATAHQPDVRPPCHLAWTEQGPNRPCAVTGVARGSVRRHGQARGAMPGPVADRDTPGLGACRAQRSQR